MIVRMLKVHAVCRTCDSDRLLNALRDLGVVHLVPVDPDKAVAEEETAAAIDAVRRALQLLESVEPAGEKPDVPPRQAAREVLDIQRKSLEHRNRLAALHRQVEQLAVWGDVTLETFRQLRDAGLDVRFFSVPGGALGEVQAELVQPIAPMPGKRTLVALVDRGGGENLPDGAEPVELPKRDRPSLRAEAAGIYRELKADRKRLGEIAHLTGALAEEREQLRRHAQYTLASRSALAGEELFAIRGWAPAEKADTLAAELAAADLHVAVQAAAPTEDEQPPTLIRYPRWARPIGGLFDILGTLPGYREFDLSGFFMLALPLFAAMLIGDAGYGLLFILLPVLLYRKLAASAGKAKTHLILVVGVVTLVWGVLTGNYFGVTPADLMAWGGFASLEAMRDAPGLCAALGRVMTSLGILWDADPETARFMIIKVSFIIGSIHLVLAHLRQAAGYWPNTKALSELGWCMVLVGMLGVIWKLFGFPLPAWTLRTALGVLLTGYVLAVVFAFPEYPVGKRIGIGFAASLLPVIGTFGDTMSYIRLMAVGLASYYIASAFNGLGAMVAQATGWLWLVGVPIILVGHLLNIGLAAISIFAHGVRLNMLEFSNGAGVQWAGYAYRPFSTNQTRES